MDFPCESEITVRNDHALRFGVVTKPAPVIDYLKTIASLIGASHILGVFEDKDFIKIYFDDKKYVDTLIRSGIHVLGHHIKVDYVVPPGSKVILSNIDPVITNYDLIRLMSMFGSVVSPVFRSPISDDTELCHIDCGVRYVYMDLSEQIPDTLEFKYGDQVCKISLKLDDSTPMLTYVKKEPIESNTTESSSDATCSNDNADQINVDDDLDATDPVVVSVQSATEEINAEELNKTAETNSPVASKLNSYKARRMKLKTSKKDKKHKHNVKYKSRRGKRFIITRKRRQIQNVACIRETRTPLSIPTSSPVSSQSPDDSLTIPDNIVNFISENPKNILDEDQLKLFLDEVRCQRAPIELVKKYLGPNYDSNALFCLIKQLTDFKKGTDDLAIKVRIRRLINNLKNFLNI